MWHSGGLNACQYYANLSIQIPFVINGTITIENCRVNHVFQEGVADLVSTKKQHCSTDVISIAKA